MSRDIPGKFPVLRVDSYTVLHGYAGSRAAGAICDSRIDTRSNTEDFLIRSLQGQYLLPLQPVIT